jgi:TolB-like protein
MTGTPREREQDEAWPKLHRRKVVQWSLAYAAGAWGLLQGLQFLADTYEWPATVLRVLTLALAAGLPIAATLAWFHGDRDHHRVSGVELAILSVLLALGAGALWLYSQRDGHLPVPATPPAAPTAAQDVSAASAGELPSIAVLPFANRSARADDAYFAEGMQDDLLAQLSRIRDVRVVSRTSVMRYAGTDKSIPEIATELGVGVVLEGGVQRAGDRVRVNVQLIDGRTDTHLWSETFDRELTVANLFEIQSEITRAIATELNLVLSASAKQRPQELPTQSTEAYNAYLLGNSLYRYDETDADRMRRAAQAFGEAVAIDPKFAEAYARKAIAHLTLVWWGVDVAENTRLAEKALERARALAPQSSGTQTAEGLYLYWVKRDYAGADAAARAALAQSPQDVRLWRLYAGVARRLGDMAASTSAFERVLTIDPQDGHAAADLGFNFAYLGQLDEARRWLSRAWALAPDSGYTVALEGVVLFLSGDVDATWRRYEELRDQAGLDPVSIDTLFSDLATTLRDPARLEVFATRLVGEEPSGEFGLQKSFARAVALDRLGRKAEARTLALDLKAQLAPYTSSADPDGGGLIRTMTIALDAFLGNAAAAREGAAALRRNPPPDRYWVVDSGQYLMSAYARIGEPDAAFDLVEQGMDQFSPVHFVSVRNGATFDPYRELPRYRALNNRFEAWKAAQPSSGR